MSQSTQFIYDQQRAGAGKTHDQLQRIVSEPGLYVFAADRREIMVEVHARLSAMAEKAGTRIHIVPVYSKRDAHAPGVDHVRVALEALPSTYGSGHVVALVTHAGLKGADLAEFSGWNLIIDEAPSLWDATRFKTTISAPLLDKMFEIVPGDLSNRIINRARHARRDLHLDTLAAPLATLHAQASDPRHQVFTHLGSWDELARSPTWTAYSLWSPAALRAFSSVTVLAAAFGSSMTYALSRAVAPEISWEELPSPSSSRPYAPRSLTIRYFAEHHHASRYRFDSDAGRVALNRVAGHLASRPSKRIWTCNQAEQSLFAARLSSGYLSPRQAGSNSWAHIDEAAIIFTAKPDLHERAILTGLGIDPQIVISTREHDTIYQFVARTSLRDPESTRPVSVYVYDRVQAEALAVAFAGQSAIKTSVELVDLGFALQTATRRNLSQMSEGEKAERKRDQAAARKRAQRERQRSIG